jgi:hypothetical protein
MTAVLAQGEGTRRRAGIRTAALFYRKVNDSSDYSTRLGAVWLGDARRPLLG